MLHLYCQWCEWKPLVKYGGSMMWDFVQKKFLRVPPTTFVDGTSYANLGPQTEMQVKEIENF
jgi:hypothetical protein